MVVGRGLMGKATFYRDAGGRGGEVRGSRLWRGASHVIEHGWFSPHMMSPAKSILDIQKQDHFSILSLTWPGDMMDTLDCVCRLSLIMFSYYYLIIISAFCFSLHLISSSPHYIYIYIYSPFQVWIITCYHLNFMNPHVPLRCEIERTRSEEWCSCAIVHWCNDVHLQSQNHYKAQDQQCTIIYRFTFETKHTHTRVISNAVRP